MSIEVMSRSLFPLCKLKCVVPVVVVVVVLVVGSGWFVSHVESWNPGGFIPCTPRKMCLADKLQLSKLAQKVRQARLGRRNCVANVHLKAC